MLQLKHSLKTRLAMILAAPVLLCLVIAAMGIKGIVDADQRATQLYEQLVAPSQAIENSYRGTLIKAIQMTEAMSSKDPELRKERLALIDKLQQGIDQQFGQFLQSPKTERLKPIASDIERDHKSYQVAVARVLGLLRDGNDEAAFAAEIVASEVRSLAQRSATAAVAIKDLIGSSVAMIQDGSMQAADVGGIIGNVQQAVKQVSVFIGEIAAASEEQSNGIEQVNQAVTLMDQMTQQNAILVEEAATAARSLDGQALQLKTAVGAFRLAATC